MYSLRRVLTVRFSITMFIALGLIALWAVAGVQRALKEQTDRAIEGTLTLFAARVAAGSPVRAIEGGEFEVSFRSGAILGLIRNASGGFVEPPPPGLNNLPIDTSAFLAAVSGRTTWTTESWHEGVVRAVYAPAPAGGPPGTSVIEVVRSLEPLGVAERQLLFTMIGTVILGTLAVGLGAYWLAGSAVAPVLEVAEQAKRIGPDTETRRITAHSDVNEYESLITVLNALLTRSEQAFNAQRRLTADLGHELRTPLTVLHGEMEIALRSERSPQRYQEVLRSGLEEIDRLTGMCDALLLITKADSQTLVLHRSPTDVNSVMLHSVDKVRLELERRGITVATRFEYTGDPLLLDADLTARIVAELVENAVNHSPERGQIVLGTSGANSHVRLWVQDSGTGIAPEHLAQLFDAFFRADEARTRSTATGLGLTLAASLARAQGGAITAANVPGGGARFDIDLHVPTARSNSSASA